MYGRLRAAGEAGLLLGGLEGGLVGGLLGLDVLLARGRGRRAGLAGLRKRRLVDGELDGVGLGPRTEVVMPVLSPLRQA